MLPAGKTGGLGQGGGMNLTGSRSGINPSAPSAQSSATGRLPGTPNMGPETVGTGGSMDWARNFRSQQTGMPAQTPFMPDTAGGAQLPNGPQVGGFLSMFQSPAQNGFQAAQAARDNFNPNQEIGANGFPVPPPGTTPMYPGDLGSAQPVPGSSQVDNYSNPFQASGGYMGALNDLTSTPIGPPPSTPEREAVRAQQQAEQQQIEADRYLKQAFEFFNNPTWDKTGMIGFNPRNMSRGWETATASYAGNPYITDAQRKQVYTDYRTDQMNKYT